MILELKNRAQEVTSSAMGMAGKAGQARRLAKWKKDDENYRSAVSGERPEVGADFCANSRQKSQPVQPQAAPAESQPSVPVEGYI
ncbi:hypothetical protein AUC43_17810 [Hymenobacter sedentarius]|uniref:Uncharacterized protein n=1 Tax=Hymenobacter sedentarius TaxID=1411621 RepID=A0A0U4C734_9BACT|nr:hypothetical protein AUC43_17810 [Hymenobacter sedentarius]